MNISTAQKHMHLKTDCLSKIYACLVGLQSFSDAKNGRQESRTPGGFSCEAVCPPILFNRFRGLFPTCETPCKRNDGKYFSCTSGTAAEIACFEGEPKNAQEVLSVVAFGIHIALPLFVVCIVVRRSRRTTRSSAEASSKVLNSFSAKRVSPAEHDMVRNLPLRTGLQN